MNQEMLGVRLEEELKRLSTSLAAIRDDVDALRSGCFRTLSSQDEMLLELVKRLVGDSHARGPCADVAHIDDVS